MQSKAEEAYEIIKRKIIMLEMRPTSDISEEALIQELNISRTPIREAIQRLAKDRFVIIYPRKGTIVSDVSLDLINCVYEVRLLNEPYMARQTVGQTTDEWIWKMKSEFQSFRPESYDVMKYIDLDYKLHNELTSYSNNMFLNSLFAVVNDHNHRIRVMTSTRNRDYSRSIREHLAILEAIEKRDPDAVEQAVRAHILTSKREAYDFNFSITIRE